MFDRVTLSFLMVRNASIVFFCVSSNSVVPFNQIEEWSSCELFWCRVTDFRFVLLKHRDENCF